MIESGNIVEYIDRHKIICAVVMEVKSQRLKLLSENDREVKLSEKRLSYKGKMRLNLSIGRYKIVETLKQTANKRNELAKKIDIKELWEVLNSEQEWIDLATMTELCFPNNLTDNYEAAVIRAFFENRLYFKFKSDSFFPNSENQVEQIIKKNEEVARKKQIIEQCGDWLKEIHKDEHYPSNHLSEEQIEYAKILKSFYLFDKSSPYYDTGKAILAQAGIKNINSVFSILVKLGLWNENENIELLKYEIPTSFSDKVIDSASKLTALPRATFAENNKRKDLTMLPVMTIDGQSTLDYDDALSIEDKGDYYRLGIHIADVGHFIQKGDILDKIAFERGSSIYMPDQKISMIPPSLSENLCSLKADELRPAISVMVKLDPFAEIIDYEIIPSIIKVKHQRTYYDVNIVADEDKEIIILYDIAKKFREKRLLQGAIQISLPEINVWLNENGEITINKISRESHARMLVSEIMIMANWLMAKFLAEHKTPAIYRFQPEPRERLYKGEQGSLFQNCMQRRKLSRFVLSHKPERHSGLGLEAYVTATSPIRRYFDLVTQRQMRAILGLENPYTSDEIKNIIQLLAQPMSHVAKIQFQRNRYWLLKYLEGKIGEKKDAIILYKRRNSCQALITDYMIECDLPLSGGVALKPEDLVQVTIQHVNARQDVFSVFGS